MPCSDGGPRCDYGMSHVDASVQQRCDLVTRLLCEMMKAWPQHEAFPSQEHESWWKKHLDEDAARVRAIAEGKRIAHEQKTRRIAALERELAELKAKS